MFQQERIPAIEGYGTLARVKAAGHIAKYFQGDIGILARRVLGLPSLQRSAFFDSQFSEENASRLREIARAVRSTHGPRIVLINGVMPRTGTNYLHSLLALHPDVVASPFNILEMSLLNIIEDARRFERAFLAEYHPDRTFTHDLEMYTYLISGFLRRIESSFPDDKIILLKSPHSRMMRYFPYLFPREQSIVIVRDGRRTIQSTIDTWPLHFFGLTFADYCREWSYGTEAAFDALSRMDERTGRLVRFETMVSDPQRTVRDLMGFLSLDDARYPYDRVSDLPILGSSTASRQNGKVTWEPVKKTKEFDPTKRPVAWSRARQAIFDAIAGNMQTKAGYATCASERNAARP